MASEAGAEISGAEVSGEASSTKVLRISLKAQGGKREKFYKSYVPLLMNEIQEEDSENFTVLFGPNYSFLKLVCKKIEDSRRVFLKVNEKKSILISGVIYDMTAEFMEDKPKASPPVDASQPPTGVSSFDTNCVKIQVTQKEAECSHSNESQNAYILHFIGSILSVSVEKSVTGEKGNLCIQLQSTEDAKEVIRVMNGFKYSQTSVWFDEKSNAFVKRDFQFQVSAAPIVSFDSQ